MKMAFSFFQVADNLFPYLLFWRN